MKRTILTTALLSLVAANAKAEPNVLPAELKDIGIEQKLGAEIPGDLVFQNHAGETVRLADLRTGRPTILALVYYECPMLCTMVLNGALRSFNVLELDAGKDFDVLTVSIDPKETPKLAAKKRDKYLSKYRRETAAEGWHFLVGDENEVKKLSDTVGFHYAWDERTKQYAHASALIVLTPDGTVSKYLYGVDYSPTTLRLALIEASKGEIGTLADALMLYCFQYDPATGAYSLVIMNVLRLAGVATLIALALLIGTLLWRDRASKRAQWVTP